LVSSKLLRQGGKAKLKQKVATFLGIFTTALRLLDIIAWLRGSAELQQQVLVHVCRPGWVGKNQVRYDVIHLFSFHSNIGAALGENVRPIPNLEGLLSGW
jgi:hypothetical protein